MRFFQLFIYYKLYALNAFFCISDCDGNCVCRVLFLEYLTNIRFLFFFNINTGILPVVAVFLDCSCILLDNDCYRFLRSLLIAVHRRSVYNLFSYWFFESFTLTVLYTADVFL